jgi:hypothetical protein
MAFPFLINIQRKDLNAAKLQGLRQAFIDNFLFAQPQFLNTREGAISEQLSQIARVLGQSAGNEPTVYDNGSSRAGATSSANALTLQVERALTQVLGRSPGRGTDGFISALNSAFPTGTNGQVMMAPARSVVSLESPNSEGLTGQLSVEQANLYRQASIIGNDALKVLDGITPFVPTADMDVVEALRALIRSQIRSLIDEFGRIDEPRKQRVETFLGTLLVLGQERIVGGSLLRLGQALELIAREDDNRSIVPVTTEDEAQVAGYELLINYVKTLQDIWQRYAAPTVSETKITGHYSERLSRVNVMLPVIADSNASFMAAMDSIGFTGSERRSDAALFTTLEAPPPFTCFNVKDSFKPLADTETNSTDIIVTITLPDMTVSDFDEWVDRFTSLEAPSILSTSGQFGLDFVTDQADTLFWTIAAVLYAITPKPNNPNQSKLLGKVLSFERVQQTLSELVFQLDTLADLGVGSISAANRATALVRTPTVPQPNLDRPFG